MSAALTPAQRGRLNSREVRILRGLILDMVGDAEEAAIEYAVGLKGGMVPTISGNRTVSARETLGHGQRVLGHYVADTSMEPMFYVWDRHATMCCTDTRINLLPWRARLAAALAIPEPTQTP